MWAGLLGAVVGAIVGGAVTLLASVIVERQKVARETRLRIYDEILPAVVDGFMLYSGSRIRQETTPASEELNGVSKS